jgi:hypothetical protein
MSERSFLAEEYEKSGNLEEALRYFKEAEERFPLERYKNLARERWMEIERRLEHRASVDDGVLFIVSCTGDKIWQENPNADRYVPAKDAYTGETVRSWLANPLSSEKRWLILSAKYGFIEPDHPICDYNVTFNDEKTGPVSDETLRNQVLYQYRWRVPFFFFLS